MSEIWYIMGCDIKNLPNSKELAALKGCDNIIHRYDDVWLIPPYVEENKRYTVIDIPEIEPSSLELQFYEPEPAVCMAKIIQVRMAYRLKCLV